MQKLIRYASILLLILFVTITQMFRTTLMSMQMQIDVLESKQSSQKSFPKKKNGEYLPEVTLLLSYPNSGTTYTLGAVRSISNTDTATNYGTESKSKERLYPKKEIKNGPYLKSLRPLPKDRILTKTHCSGYSNTQPINNYIVNPKDFERSCNSKNGKVKYDRRVLPKSAIRLIRDPFDNTVSNYHHWLHNLMTPRQKKAMDEIPTDEERFKKFCNIFDTLFEEKMKKERVSSSFKDRYTKDLLEGVPCHQFFFRYTQVSHLGFFLISVFIVLQFVTDACSHSSFKSGITTLIR